MAYYVGIDIGGTKTAIVLARSASGESIEFLERRAFATQPAKGFDDWFRRTGTEMEKLLAEKHLDITSIEAIGMSCGGPLDNKRGILYSPPNLVGWGTVSIVDHFKNNYGIHACLENDANACALAEWKFGAAQGCKNVIFLTFGTGMGAGLILGGKLYSGTNNNAGEIGHVRLAEHGPVGYGKAGSFEGFCSGGGIAQLARTRVMEKLQGGTAVSFCSEAAALESLDARKIAEAAEEGDPFAAEILKECGMYLGRGLSLLVDLLNPERIVIGSIFARCTKFLWPAAEAVLQKECLPLSLKVCKVVPAGLGEHIGDYAAVAVALGYEE